ASRRYHTQLERKLFAGGLDRRQSPRMGRRGGIPKDADPPRLRQGFRHHLQSLGSELGEQHRRARYVPARPRASCCGASATGSAWTANTMGIVVVACLAASTNVDDGAKITSTCMRTSSATSAGSSSTFCAHCHSMMMLVPSM